MRRGALVGGQIAKPRTGAVSPGMSQGGVGWRRAHPVPLQVAAVAAATVGWVDTSLVPPADVARSGSASGPTGGMEKPRAA